MLDARQRSELVQGIYSAAQSVGAKPDDLARVIGYETAGTFDPWKAGPVTHWGQHRGLIQCGEPQARQYGVSATTPVSAQMQAVAKYLRDRGFKPGMGLLDLYSTVNAGRPGAYKASDGYGTVASHVQKMLGQGDVLGRLAGGVPLAVSKSSGASAFQQRYPLQSNAPGAQQAPAQASPIMPTPASGLVQLFGNSGQSPLLADTYDPAIGAGGGGAVGAPQVSGSDPAEERRKALIESIGRLFG